MRISSISNTFQKPSFQGFQQIKNAMGEQEVEFNFPFDDEKYDCYLEIYNVSTDDNGNYKVNSTNPIKNFNSDNSEYSFQLHAGSNRISPANDYFLNTDEPFAYHYKLIPKGGNIPIYRTDAGDVIDNTIRNNNGKITDKYSEIYNLVIPVGSKIRHGGSMKLVIPDNFNVGYKYNPQLFNAQNILQDNETLIKAKKSFKHFSNKMGGTLAGVEKAIDDGEFDGYSSIISLPIFTDDSRSAHGYWNKNCMQMIPTLGNINNYASLQRKMFAKGINFVSDGAFVNEGLEGIHFAHVLKWGEESPFFNWFKAQGLKNNVFTLGVFGKLTEHISHKIVNSPYTYTENDSGQIQIKRNKDYDSAKPTFIQLFDDRLVSEKQKNDATHLIKDYDNLSTDNPYEINTHDDTVINYVFEINPETYNKNIANLNEYNKSHNNKISMRSYEGTKFLGQFENFELETKIESNFNTWDANTDIAKLNYSYSHADTEVTKNKTYSEQKKFKEDTLTGSLQAQDYITTSGIYWTQKTKDILSLHIAQNLKNINPDNSSQTLDIIQNKIQQGTFPQKLSLEISDDIVKNVLNNNYNNQHVIYPEAYDEQVKMGIMNFPLDSIEFGDNIAGVLATPYITKRAIHDEEIGKTPYEMYKLNNPHLKPEYKKVYDNMQHLYSNELLKFSLSVLDKVKQQTPVMLEQDNQVTEFGSYVLPLLTTEIAKYAIIKSLNPNTEVYVNSKNGEIGYDYESLKKLSLQSFDIKGLSPEDEANQLVEKIRTGIKKLTYNDKQHLANALSLSIKGLNEKHFALADMIIDKTGSGLDWRIDATKDVADIDSLRNHKNNFEYSWQQITDFWEKFTQSVLKINPNAYVVAEVTDENDLYDTGGGENSKFSKNDITRTFLNNTGITATANYSYFFTDMAMMFGQRTEYDKNSMEYDIDKYFQERIYQKFAGAENYLHVSNLNSLLYSYTFIGNHDKPRMLHCFALDMNLFFSDLKNTSNKNYRELAYRIINNKLNDNVNETDIAKFDYNNVSSKAVAMADVMVRAFGNKLADLSKENKTFSDNKDAIYESVMKSISDLAKGHFLDANFNPDAFGTKPFDVTIDAIFKQAEEKYNLPLNKNEIELYKASIFKAIVQPAYTKLLGAMKYLVALPGKPTLFSGDDLGASGYEEKTKNIYLQNRNYLHNEWKDENPFIRQCYNELNQVMSLRNRPELDALNNGAPYILPLQTATDKTNISALLRQNTDGRMTISLFNTKGITHKQDEIYTPRTVKLNEINLDDINGNGSVGLTCGLHTGMEFVNATNKDDKYKVFSNNGHYVIKHQDGTPIKINDSTLILYHVPTDLRLYKYEYKPYSPDVEKQYKNVHTS